MILDPWENPDGDAWHPGPCCRGCWADRAAGHWAPDLDRVCCCIALETST